MIKITEKNPTYCGETFDYKLENGELLHCSEWNGEEFVKAREETTYKPVYQYDEEYDCYEIVGFEA